MINKKTIKLIYILIFLGIFSLHFHQLNSQHWSGVLDQDLIIIYNSILLNSGIEQEYRDHPAYTTFLINSLVYKILNIFSAVPEGIDEILDSDKINSAFQFYFNVSRVVNFIFNLIIILIFNQIVKKFGFKKNLRFLVCLIFILSIGYISSFFFIRSENLSLLFFLLAVNAMLSKNRDLFLSLFIAGMFFALAMLAKIQIIFLALYLVYLIPILNDNNEYYASKNSYLLNYLYLSFFVGFCGFLIFQIYIQEFPRFITNKYLDLIFFVLSFILFLFYFYFSRDFKKNLTLFSSMLNGFACVIFLIFLLDKINFLQVNNYIFLRITNPLHYMTEFTGKLANGAVDLDYIVGNFFQIFSFYRFNLVELILILIIIFLNFKKKNYSFVLIFIFMINTLVMNFRYYDVYHLFYVFIYLILLMENMSKLSEKTSTKMTILVFIVFFANSLNFLLIKEDNFLSKIYNRENSMVKICKQFKFKIPTNSYESVDYIKYWHNKIDDEKLNKICDEII